MAVTFNAWQDASYIFRYSITPTGVSSTLNGDITSTQTTITLTDASSFSSSGKIRIGYEVITYTGKNGNQLTGCTRGAEYTGANGSKGTGYSHSSGATVDQITTSYSSNLASSTSFDYFQDDIQVGDILWFGRLYYPFNDILVNVGTALSADSITLEWQYHGGNTGKVWSDLMVTDNTNSFQNTGQNTIDFAVPLDWGFQYWDYNYNKLNGIISTYLVRCRVTAVTNPTEGGANATNKVQIGNNTLVVTGGSSGSRLTLDDVYNADVSSGWGVITYDGLMPNTNRSYKINANIEIGDGSTATYFDFRRNNVFFLGYDKYIKTQANSNVLFGTQIGSYEAGGGGCLEFVRTCPEYKSIDFSAGTISGYGLKIKLTKGVNSWAAGLVLLSNSNLFMYGLVYEAYDFSSDEFPSINFSNGTFKNCRFSRGWRSATINNANFTDCIFWVDFYVGQDGFLYVGGGAVYIYNIDASMGGAVLVRNHVRNGANLYLRNCVGFYDIPNIYHPSGGQTSYQWKQFSLSLKVVDVENTAIPEASVKITNPNISDINLTTDSNGEITQQWLTYCKGYDDYTTYFWGTGNRCDYFGDYTVTISKEGYQTKIMKLTMDRKRELIVVLEKAVDYITPFGEKLYINLDSTNSQNTIKWIEA